MIEDFKKLLKPSIANNLSKEDLENKFYNSFDANGEICEVSWTQSKSGVTETLKKEDYPDLI